MAMTAQEKLDAKREKEYNKKHKRMYKLKPGDIVFNILNYLFFILFTLTCIFPFYYLFINTISDNAMVQQGLINFIPHGLNINNYKALAGVGDLGYAFVVSITRTIFGTALMVVASAFVGYLVTKQEMWHRSLWYRAIVITMYFNAGLIATYLNLVMLGLTNHYMVYIIPGIVAQSAGYYPAVVMSKSYAVTHNDTMQAYAGGVIRPLARVFDCTTFYGAVSSATGFAYKKHHLFSHYGPYSDSRRRHARNWLRDNLPAGSYKVIINTKRAIFGPHEGPYED